LKAGTDDRTAVISETTKIERTLFRIGKERLPGVPRILHNWPTLIRGVTHEDVRACWRHLYASAIIRAASYFSPLKITDIQIV